MDDVSVELLLQQMETVRHEFVYFDRNSNFCSAVAPNYKCNMRATLTRTIDVGVVRHCTRGGCLFNLAGDFKQALDGKQLHS